ncbi:hypothetical protein STEG23_013152 [Scotinomys teguina]
MGVALLARGEGRPDRVGPREAKSRVVTIKLLAETAYAGPANSPPPQPRCKVMMTRRSASWNSESVQDYKSQSTAVELFNIPYGEPSIDIS